MAVGMRKSVCITVLMCAQPALATHVYKHANIRVGPHFSGCCSCGLSILKCGVQQISIPLEFSTVRCGVLLNGKDPGADKDVT